MYNPYDTPEPLRENHIHVEYKRNNIFKRKKSGTSTINAGGAIIIIIFVVLCLTIFGLLSFTTAFADKKLADRTLKSVQDYYLADTKAEQMLAEIYNNFTDIILSAALSSDEYSDLEITETETTGVPAFSIAYQTQMNDVQALASEIIFFYDNDRLDYKITRWNIILTAEFDYDTKEVDVWDGSFEIFE